MRKVDIWLCNWAELKIGKSHCAQIRTLILSASLICTPRLLTQD